MPKSKNNVSMVLKSGKQGTGKGLIIDVLIGRNILGDSSYVQVTNMEGLFGKFNSILMNKILVMVDEVAMTKKRCRAGERYDHR